MKIICDIPSEIRSHIFKSIGINSIVMMTQISKDFHKKKKQIYLHYFQNDHFLLRYMKKNNINIIRMVSESAFSFEEFDTMYECIKHNKIEKKSCKNLTLIEDNKTQYQINNTFRIFQMLKLSVYDYNITKEHQYWYNACKIIMNTMECYFKDLFFIRNKNKVYISFIDTSLSENYVWEKSNINLYNICENLNLIYCDKNSDNRLKKNLENFSSTIIKNDGKNVVTTASLLQCMFKKNNFYEKLNFEIYINYVFFHYLNFMFKCNLYQEVLENQEFYDHSFDIYKKFKTRINDQPPDIIAPYLKNMILNKLEEYTSYILLYTLEDLK